MSSKNSRAVRLRPKMRKLLFDFKTKNNLRSIGEAGELIAGDINLRRRRRKIIRELEF